MFKINIGLCPENSFKRKSLVLQQTTTTKRKPKKPIKLKLIFSQCSTTTKSLLQRCRY